jgi:hypothetical protein
MMASGGALKLLWLDAIKARKQLNDPMTALAEAA